MRSATSAAAHPAQLRIADSSPSEPDHAVRRARLGDPVGVEDDGVAAVQLDLGGREVGIGHHAQQRSRARRTPPPCRPSAARSGAGGRRSTPPRASTGRRPEARQRDGAELVGERPLGEHRAVQRAQQLVGRIVAAHRGGAQRVPRQGGDGRGIGALAADVADRDRPLVGPAHEDVVEVSADLVRLPGRAEPGGDLDAGDLGQVGRQQALLELGRRCSCSRRTGARCRRRRQRGARARGSRARRRRRTCAP